MTTNPLTGRWRLVSWENKSADGAVSFPFGKGAAGYIQYDADGFMFAAVMHDERPHLTEWDPFSGTVSDKARVSETFISYCGRYEYQGDTVVHHVELALYPGWVGGDQTRLVELAGNRLTLSTRPSMIEGREQTARLVWERVR